MRSMSLSPETMAWLKWMVITSVPLRRLGAGGAVQARASGCMIDYLGRRFVLATPHVVTRESTGWAIDLGNRQGGGAEIFTPTGFAYAGEFSRGATLPFRETDFCFAEVPTDLVSIYKHETFRGVFDVRPRHVFDTDLCVEPDLKQIYAFAGEVGTEFHEGVNALVADMVVYPGLRFLRQEDEMLVFQLPEEHPGHDQFVGCSGAPIVGRDGRPIALVCSGDSSTGTIRGISLALQKVLLDFWCGEGQPATLKGATRA
jgi:hypothetical protein